MQIFIFIVGLFVSVLVVSGLYALVPREIRSPDEFIYRRSDGKTI